MRSAIFDGDDTLWETEHLYDRARQAARSASGKRVHATEDACRDETYLLSEKEQAEAANLEVVTSIPIKNEAQGTIGVLTAYGDNNDGWIDSAEG